MAAALAAYQRTLISLETRFEHYLRRGDPRLLSPIERDGHLIFEQRAGCSACHVMQPGFRDGAPLQLSDFQFHNTGIGYKGKERFTDEGRARVMTKRKADLGAFRTPALRNLGKTAPPCTTAALARWKTWWSFMIVAGTRTPIRIGLSAR
jgi:cytochrome c peroxidase